MNDLWHETLVVPRRGQPAIADLLAIRRPGWEQLITPSFRYGGLNEVSLAVLDDAEVEGVIDRTLAEYRALGLAFRWTVGPDSRPLDLGARLERRGLVPHEIVAMYRSTATEVGAAVERVDAQSVGEFTDVLARGWSMDPGPLTALHAAALADPEGRHPMFLARSADGAPIGGAGMVIYERSAYLIGAVVLSEHRGRGAYSALVHARLAHAAAMGRTLATVQARAETAAPRLARLGFQEVLRFRSYRSV